MDDDALRGIEFSKLHQKLNGRLFQFAYSRLGDADLAQDIVSDVWVRAWGSRKFEPTHERAGAFLRRSLQWLINDRLDRDRDKLPEVSLDATTDGATRDVPDVRIELDPEGALMQLEDQGLIKRCVDGLSGVYREAVLRYCFTSDTYAGVGQSLGISLTAARMRINRGRQQLRECLEASGFLLEPALDD